MILCVLLSHQSQGSTKDTTLILELYAVFGNFTTGGIKPLLNAGGNQVVCPIKEYLNIELFSQRDHVAEGIILFLELFLQ